MEFVEEHGADTAQLRIVNDHPREDALGDDLDAGVWAGDGGETRPEPDRFAQLFIHGVRHAIGGGTGREPPWLQHEDLAALEPCRIDER